MEIVSKTAFSFFFFHLDRLSINTIDPLTFDGIKTETVEENCKIYARIDRGKTATDLIFNAPLIASHYVRTYDTCKAVQRNIHSAFWLYLVPSFVKNENAFRVHVLNRMTCQ